MQSFPSSSVLLFSYPLNISSCKQVLLGDVLCSPCNNPLYIQRVGEVLLTISELQESARRNCSFKYPPLI